uniref:CASTOR ACT domain-containing protein n=1 Tax=Lotharella oceanica TaxID=641309 RepID=A0A7S2TQE5_9EUKA|mmetsp:Transcript_23142/g.43391  ORF Transcript_23142/g.43391 Transcript_23142/m.43391 type:complete len:455 (+) Transcript_23142:56-1420(+)
MSVASEDGHLCSSSSEAKMDILLRVLDTSLTLVSFSRSHLIEYTSMLVQLMLFPPANSVFFTFTETRDDEVSVIVDEVRMKVIMQQMEARKKERRPVFCPTPWVGFQVNHGKTGGCSTSDLVAKVSQCLADAKFSIFYVSTLNTDYVLVEKHKVKSALRTLKKTFNLLIDYDGMGTPTTGTPTTGTPYTTPGATPPLGPSSSPTHTQRALPLPLPSLSLGAVGSSCRSPSEAKKGSYLSLPGEATASAQANSSPQMEEGGNKKVSKVASASRIRLEVLSNRLVLCTVPKRDLDFLAKPLLGEFLNMSRSVAEGGGGKGKEEKMRGARRFFSYTEADDQISLAMGEKAYARLMHYKNQYQLGFQEEPGTWRAIRVKGKWGFDEVGLVAAISNALHIRQVDLVYLSTFTRDFVLVPAQDFAKAEECLKARSSLFSLDTEEQGDAKERVKETKKEQD